MNLPKCLARLCVVVVVAVLGVYSPAKSQENPKPTPEHKILAADEGTWDADVKGFMAGPDAEPMVSKGTEVNTVLPGGLWLLSTFQTDGGSDSWELCEQAEQGALGGRVRRPAVGLDGQQGGQGAATPALRDGRGDERVRCRDLLLVESPVALPHGDCAGGGRDGEQERAGDERPAQAALAALLAC